MVGQIAERQGSADTKDKFLCGHAGMPERATVSSVVTAKEAHKPEFVRNLESGKKGKQKKRHRRKTDTFIRQQLNSIGETLLIRVVSTTPVFIYRRAGRMKADPNSESKTVPKQQRRTDNGDLHQHR